MHTRGIEPRSQAWKACMMPLHYVCDYQVPDRMYTDSAFSSGLSFNTSFAQSQNAETRDRAGDLQIFGLTLSKLSYRGLANGAIDWRCKLHLAGTPSSAASHTKRCTCPAHGLGEAHQHTHEQHRGVTQVNNMHMRVQQRTPCFLDYTARRHRSNSYAPPAGLEPARIRGPTPCPLGQGGLAFGDMLDRVPKPPASLQASVPSAR